MLAAAGWPISELADKGLAKAFNLPVELTSEGMAPSLLNGGLSNVSPIYWAVVVAAAAAVEFAGMRLEGDAKATGDFGFDPLGLYPSGETERLRMQDSELIHGRTAMMAIVAFASQEFIGKTAVVQETPFFFEPIWKFVHDAGIGDFSAGYIAT
jgi:hypothetical protein